jgi:Mitochondrial ATPase expression
MRGSVPSRRALSCFAQPSPSRIPHLKLHVLARHAPESVLVPGRHPPVQRRGVYAASASYSLSRTLFTTNEDLDRTSTSTSPTVSSGTQSEVESQRSPVNDSLDEILQQAHPERVLYTLLATPEGTKFVAQAPAESFAAALCSVDPWYLLEPFKDVYRGIKPSLATSPKYRWVRAIEDRLDSFAGHLNEIVHLRRSAGHKLTSDVCTHLLHCARVLGYGQMARQVWQILIPEDGIQNDLSVRAYNCYMEAICWSNAFSKTEQWRLRVTPRILRLRQSDNPPPDLSGHRTGPIGLRHETLVTFRRMVSRQSDGDEETFTNLMIAMGREGDITGAKSILKSVYNIDVDLLLAVDEEEVETPTLYEADSPLRPTARLLQTIAHVFGANNDIVLAFKLVDFVSRQYDIRIPFVVWMHLLNWAFVLSCRRFGAQKKKDQAIGQVAACIFDTIWTEMTGEPHNIKPDVVMYTLRARSFRGRGMLQESLESIASAKALFEHSRGEAQKLGEELVALTDQLLTHRPTNLLQTVPAEWLSLRRRFVLASLAEDRDLQVLIVTIRTTLTERGWLDYGEQKSWERRRLPVLVAELAEYLPNTLLYRTRGRHIIEIAGLKSDRIGRARNGMAMSRMNGLLRAHVDRDIATFDDLSEARLTFKIDQEEIERTNDFWSR